LSRSSFRITWRHFLYFSAPPYPHWKFVAIRTIKVVLCNNFLTTVHMCINSMSTAPAIMKLSKA
jgi:hypothetical protein